MENSSLRDNMEGKKRINIVYIPVGFKVPVKRELNLQEGKMREPIDAYFVERDGQRVLVKVYAPVSRKRGIWQNIHESQMIQDHFKSMYHTNGQIEDN